MPYIGCRNHDWLWLSLRQEPCLRSENHISIEREVGRGWLAHTPRLCPQLGCQQHHLGRDGQVPSGGFELVQASQAPNATSPD